MIRKSIAVLTFFVTTFIALTGQTQDDTIFNYFSETPVTIDGSATEPCWDLAEWHAVDQVWIPWGTPLAPGDFEGRFKVAWDSSFLYVLVEVVDDSLSDDHSNPLDNWWEDDCLEVFIDEDRSKGDHELTCNAFAYHISLFYDVIDLTTFWNGINYKDHIEVVMEPIGENTYMWEMAIKIYNETYNHSNPEASRETLFPGKEMGFALAYCDNDETTGRENFIGSMVMTQANHNEMYRNADYFGLMKLFANDPTGLPGTLPGKEMVIGVYPVPARDHLTLSVDQNCTGIKEVTIRSLTGAMIRSEYFYDHSHRMSIGDLTPGAYILTITAPTGICSQVILK
ncbi:MAG: hypothetical protein JXR52_12700 [Bacteroidales bacterium]|nr:hypothetical protein [Bacteroidales bacterium]